MNTKKMAIIGLAALIGGYVGGVVQGITVTGQPAYATAEKHVENVIRANRIELIDSQGQARAALYVEKDSTVFTMGTVGKGRRSFVVRINNDGALAFIGDPTGHQVQISAHAGTAELAMTDSGVLVKDDKMLLPRLKMTTDKDGPRIQMADANGKLRMLMGSGKLRRPDAKEKFVRSEGSILIYSPKGRVTHALPPLP